ncbi:hypothetical protein AB0J63_42480 [Streptosporangium canum]|uniref:zinc finger domain-containing protein n=1 Tax=Streptosporangium canum TaxID=324952 RepID=UPI00342030BC
MSKPEITAMSDADEIERHPCPRCLVEPGSPCRSRSGTVAGTYHTGRFAKVPRLAKLLRAPTPTDRVPERLWRPGTPPPAPIPADTPATDIRVAYARCSHLTQELQSQLDALAAHGIPREKIFAEKVSTRVRVRPKFEAALEGLNAAARKGNHGGRPPVITDDMLHTVLRRRANGESVGDIRPALIIPTGKRKGQHPSLASIYRALAEHEKRQAYPEAVEQAHADFAMLQAST